MVVRYFFNWHHNHDRLLIADRGGCVFIGTICKMSISFFYVTNVAVRVWIIGELYSNYRFDYR